MKNAIASVRRFNRFYTEFVGALDSNFLESGMTLAEARVLFEIAQRETCFADDIQRALDLDAGFVSRVLRRFEGRRWIQRVRLHEDGRRRSIRPSALGRRKFEQLDTRQREVVRNNLTKLDIRDRDRLVTVLDTAQKILEEKEVAAFTIRTFRAGDMGLLASRQSVLYREHYKWNSMIEVNIGEVTTAFLKNFKEGREQAWIAEVDGQMAGSILLTDEGNGLCRLRLLYVEPAFQGRGIGDALVTTCLDFARSVGYERMTLWTHTILKSARKIYARHGFRITETKTHKMFGSPLKGETWTLELAKSQARE
jgi:DNA-binding MarR family transcriptional regulator/GNAT superfamily N-acetyltransferase